MAEAFPGLFSYVDFLEMDIRDLRLWIREAQIKEIRDKAKRYAAELLPHRETEEVNKEIKRIEYGQYELEHEDEIDDAERDVREHIEKRKKRRQ